MSDIRSFFGGGKPAVTAKDFAAKPTAVVEPAVDRVVVTEKTSDSPETAVSNQISCPVVSDGLPSDVQKIITWKAGEPVPYMVLVEIFEEISRVSGRLEKENLFAKLFRAVIATTPADLDVIVYLASNEVSPVYEGRELGIGDSLLVKAVCEATGRKKDAVEEAYEKEGDLVSFTLWYPLSGVCF
jgi:DNA ligase-1